MNSIIILYIIEPFNKKMHNYEFVIGILMIISLAKRSLEEVDNNGMAKPSLTMFKDMEGECNTYCFGLVKPILQQTKQSQFTDLQDKMRQLYTMIKSTEKQLNEVQVKLGVCEDATKNRQILATEQFNRKVTQLKELQIQSDMQEINLKQMAIQLGSLQNRISVCNETVRNRDIQYAQLQDLYASCSNSSQVKDVLIATNKALIDKHQAASQGQSINLELKERHIDELETSLKAKEKLLLEQQLQIAEAVFKIKELKGELADNEQELKKCNSVSCWGKSSEIHIIRLAGLEAFPVYCDSTLAEGGWTVLLRRRDGSINFNRNWTDYRLGFGDLRGEFFMGLEKIHKLTMSQPYELYIYMQDFNDQSRHARYNHFQIADESASYRLISLGKYQGTAGDSLSSQKDMLFSTPDRDNDWASNNCAQDFRAGWWYRKCYYCNLNGQYFSAKTTNQYGINWFSWHTESLKFVQMMIRPKAH